jgi:hypothetical protein
MPPHFFEKRDRWGNGLALWVVVGMVFLIPLSLWSLSSIKTENEVHNWISKDNPDHKAFEWYKQHFPTDDAILFTWEGSSLGDERTEVFAQKIRGTTTADGRRRGGSKYFSRVRTPHDLLAQMRKNKIPQDEALRRLEGVLIGSGPVRIRLTDAGRARQDKFIELLRKQAREVMHVELEIVSGPFSDGAIEMPDVANADASDSGNGARDAEPPIVASGEVVDETGQTAAALVIPPHDLTVAWRGMHWAPEQIGKFEELAKGLRFATAGAAKSADKPLVEECFRIPGTPIALALYLSEPGRAPVPSIVVRRRVSPDGKFVGPADTLLRLEPGSQIAGIRSDGSSLLTRGSVEAEVYALERSRPGRLDFRSRRLASSIARMRISCL